MSEETKEQRMLRLSEERRAIMSRVVSLPPSARSPFMGCPKDKLSTATVSIKTKFKKRRK